VKDLSDNIKENAALNAIGALDGEEARAFVQLLSENAEARNEAAAFSRVAEALARSLPAAPSPSPELKERILREAWQRKARTNMETTLKQLTPPSLGGFAFLRQASESGWVPLPVAGASVKLLSFDDDAGYAMVLGKLEPGTRYPGHTHLHSEDIYMLSGDLHVGHEIIRAGDFHHAEAGTSHPVNWSEQGCVLLAVLSKEDLLAQFGPLPTQAS
jgi:quercetin dioxygenase-like cupin family protein